MQKQIFENESLRRISQPRKKLRETEVVDEPQDNGQKKLRRSARFSSAQQSPQLQNDIISQALKQGGRSNAIQQRSTIGAQVTHHTPFDSPPIPNHRTHLKQSRPTEPPQERAREDDVNTPPERTLNRTRTFVSPIGKTIKEARIEFWNENGIWPTDKQEAIMGRFRDLVNHARAHQRSLSRKRSNASLTSDTTPTQITGTISRDQKCAPYKHPLFERQLKECGSFMDEHELGITAENEKLCHQLLNGPQAVPQHTLFSDDVLFRKTWRRMKGENETKVVQRLSQFIIPSAEVLADRGIEHLAVVRETTNSCWVNAKPFMYPLGSRSAPCPQPDFGLGFDRDAFNVEQLQKLQPFFGDLLADYSLFAATYQMYFPFLTCEVNCGDGGLDVADRHNAHSQSIILRGIYSLFQLVGREKELNREINGFSLSHNDEAVWIWGHYAVIDGKNVKFYRHLISKFIFAPTGEGDQRWKAYKFVKNVYDLWLPDHFKRICSAVDMLPADLSSEDAYLPKLQSPGTDLDSSRSGLSQQLDQYNLIEEQTPSDRQPAAQVITPETTTEPDPSNSRKKKRKPV